MQFLLEILTLLVLFYLFRAGVKRVFPASKSGMVMSEDSLRAEKRYRWRFSIIFTVLGLLLSLILVFVIHFLFNFFHGLKAEQVVLIERTALIYPSLILGFSISSFMAPALNMYLQKDGLGFFLQDYGEEVEGFSYRKAKAWQVIVALALVVLLLIPQSNIYIKLIQNELSWRLPLEEQRTVKLSEIEQVKAFDEDDFTIYFSNGDSLSTVGFSNKNKEELIKKITPH